ncbi:MAG: DNA mismatch repair protein MutT [Chlamydiae bacterium CG10_big_fil_rev_8_21_14_0_10_35_9]|nr:MAG: DNA mismatch repair protein MutT [Chlamydiae bacterium CG10_big_fil_rev_8_21_14_0_10_35_9]
MNFLSSKYKQHPRVGVGCVVQRKGKVLLGKRKGAHGEGSWAFPGGHLEYGEKVSDCAARELFEETGLKALSLHEGPWVENIMTESQKHYITVFVFVDEFAGEPELLEPNKCEGWQWFSWDGLPEPLFSTISSLIEKESILINKDNL